MKRTLLVVGIFASLFSVMARAADIPPGFESGYVVRTGDLNGDGLTDIYLQPKRTFVPIALDDLTIPVPLPTNVGEFVLQKNASGEFTLVSALTSAAKSAVKQWAINQAIKILRRDVNIDGAIDIILGGVGSAIPGGKNVIVFASPNKNAPPTLARNVDSTLDTFIKDVGGFSDNPNYFQSGVSVQCWIVYLQTLHFDPYSNEYYYSYDPYVVCQYVFDPSGFSVPAIKFLNRFVPMSNSGQLVAQSAEATDLSQQLTSIFGIEFFKRALELGGYSDQPECQQIPYPDTDYCVGPKRLGDLVQILRDLVTGARDAVSCSHGVEHHYALMPEAGATAQCTIGQAVSYLYPSEICTTQRVYQEQLVHPVLGFTLHNTPVREGETGVAELGLWGSLDDGGPIIFHLNKPILWHQNHTLPEHRFHPGYVNRQTVVQNGKAYITTEGGGTGDCKTFNEIVGLSVFRVDDLLIKSHIKLNTTRFHDPIP